MRCFFFFFPRISLLVSQKRGLTSWLSAHFDHGANQMRRERCIWARLYCSSSSSTARLWAHPSRLVPPWTSTMWKGRGSRRYEVRFWANSDWQVLRTPSDPVKSPIRSKRCTTVPRSYWRSSGGIGSRLAVRTTQRQSTTPKRYTNSTWSTDHRKAVSIAVLSGGKKSLYCGLVWAPVAIRTRGA